MTETLTPALERALFATLREEWQLWNRARFRTLMRPPVLAFDATAHRLGQWDSATRTLSLSRDFVLSASWPVVIEVLKHEMAHQFVDEILKVRDEPAHGPTFQRICAERGIDARAAGRPEEGADDEAHVRLASKIQKLLALAESSNVHEAENAMRAARKLLVEHNVELDGLGKDHGYRHRHVGPVLGRVHEWQKVLATLLVEHFFVEAIWVSAYRVQHGKRGSQLELVGSPANLAVADYVHAYLSDAAPRLWAAHKTSQGVAGDRERLPYFAGLMTGFRAKLQSDARRGQEAGLVWVRSAELDQFFRRRHPYVRSVAYGGRNRSDAFFEGQKDGGRIELRKPVGGPSATGPRLLGAAKGG